MKKILITGKNSYIGTGLEKWLSNYPDSYLIDTISLKDNLWKEKDFSEYDVVFHVAGIAHIKETGRNQDLYFKVNRDLTFEIAKKSKENGVKQFIFLSSMSVYGVEKGVIYKDTQPMPKSAYGKSKIEAEELINQLVDDLFVVATIRPPMVYGKGCKGNYPRLAALALRTPVFPEVVNRRSMIFIDNLSEFVRQLVDSGSGGLYFPQNIEYTNTSEMVRKIAEVHGKTLRMTKLFNPLLKLLNLNTVNKVFGDLIYDISMSEYERDYNICKFEESIYRTEMETVK